MFRVTRRPECVRPSPSQPCRTKGIAQPHRVSHRVKVGEQPNAALAVVTVRAEDRRNGAELDPSQKELAARQILGVGVARGARPVVKPADVMRQVPPHHVRGRLRCLYLQGVSRRRTCARTGQVPRRAPRERAPAARCTLRRVSVLEVHDRPIRSLGFTCLPVQRHLVLKRVP